MPVPILPRWEDVFPPILNFEFEICKKLILGFNRYAVGRRYIRYSPNSSVVSHGICKLRIRTAWELYKNMSLTRNKLLRHSKKYEQLDGPRYRLNPFPVQLGATNQLPVPAATMGYLLLVILFRLLFFQE